MLLDNSATDILLFMLLALFALGAFSFAAGVFILLRHTLGNSARSLTLKSNRLAQKGLLDGVADLVNAASSLMDAANQLVRTATGIGAFLVLIGLALMILPAAFIIWKLPVT